MLRLEQEQQAYYFFDSNGDGYLTKEEFGDACRAAGCNPTLKLVDEGFQMAMGFTGKRSNQPFDTCTFEGYYNAGLPHLKKHGCIKLDELRHLSSFLDRRKDGMVEVVAVCNLTKNFGDRLTNDEVSRFRNIIDPEKTGRAHLPDLTERILKDALQVEASPQGLKQRFSQV